MSVKRERHKRILQHLKILMLNGPLQEIDISWFDSNFVGQQTLAYFNGIRSDE
jgi:hypothetical protein